MIQCADCGKELVFGGNGFCKTCWAEWLQALLDKKQMKMNAYNWKPRDLGFREISEGRYEHKDLEYLRRQYGSTDYCLELQIETNFNDKIIYILHIMHFCRSQSKYDKFIQLRMPEEKEKATIIINSFIEYYEDHNEFGVKIYG